MTPRRAPTRTSTSLPLRAILGTLALALAHCQGAASSCAEPVPRSGPRTGEGSTAAARPQKGGSNVALTILCKAPSHPISPLIYGISARPNRDAPEMWRLGATARRWGGNHTTRYNWELGNAWNTGKDWYFKNVDYDRSPRPAHQRFIDDDMAHGLATVMTVPMIGWVAGDSTSSGFPVSVFGPQRGVEPHHPDVGDGVTPRGDLVTPGPPQRTSVPMPPAGIGRWVRANRARDAGGKRGVHAYILDNEPTLWHETHRDVHPQPLSYDELLARTIAYATEIRAADPGALIAGPAMWGWTSYFYSGVDTAAYPAHPDRDAHGGVALIPWWLGEVAAHERRTGTRLLDILDVHFYPQGERIGIGTAGATDPDTAARRIRSTRALWDPTYEDESWIADEVRLIPRLEGWIAEKHPGLGISIGEYNFGAEEHMSGGLAVAEALGRFGQLGITSAFYWDYPPQGSPAALAFHAYRSFDGRGARFLDESVQAESSSPMVSIFASRDAAHMVVVLLGLDPAVAHAARIDATSCGRVASLTAFDLVAGASAFAPAAVALPRSNAPIETTLPPYSITVLDLQLAQTP